MTNEEASELIDCLMSRSEHAVSGGYVSWDWVHNTIRGFVDVSEAAKNESQMQRAIKLLLGRVIVLENKMQQIWDMAEESDDE